MDLLYPQESYLIQGGCFEVYKQLRNRHKEKVYERALTIYLKEKGLNIETQKQIAILFNNKKIGVYVPDMIVNDSIILELKCKSFVTQQDIYQFWHYLKSTSYRLGYLINFGAEDGVQLYRRIYDKARPE